MDGRPALPASEPASPSTPPADQRRPYIINWPLPPPCQKGESKGPFDTELSLTGKAEAAHRGQSRACIPCGDIRGCRVGTEQTFSPGPALGQSRLSFPVHSFCEGGSG